MRLFIDSSALVKLYIEESGSEYVSRMLEEAQEIVVSIICVPEVISACSRLLREKK